MTVAKCSLHRIYAPRLTVAHQTANSKQQTANRRAALLAQHLTVRRCLDPQMSRCPKGANIPRLMTPPSHSSPTQRSSGADLVAARGQLDAVVLSLKGAMFEQPLHQDHLFTQPRVPASPDAYRHREMTRFAPFSCRSGGMGNAPRIRLEGSEYLTGSSTQ
jgi:hypothetical protein